MMSVDTLVCSCGMRLKLPGAVPGRVGKCPRCGSFLKVPERPARVESPTPPEVATARPIFVEHRGRRRKPPSTGPGASDGLIKPPSIAETRLVDSLLYPLWNASGLGIIGFMPLGLWIATVPLFALIPTTRALGAFSVLGVILLIPQLLLFFFVGGNTLRFLGSVLVTSSLGEVALPRSPSWSLSEIGEGLWPWFWALLIGAGVGGLPALIYWINCGDVDWLDRIILIDLIVPGLAYAQMALLAALIFESPLAANPVTVVWAIGRVGWAYVSPCVMTGSAMILLAGLFDAVLQIQDGFSQSVAYWAFWVASLYAAMVVLRRLGLFCYRHAVVLDWFPDRTRSAR